MKFIIIAVLVVILFYCFNAQKARGKSLAKKKPRKKTKADIRMRS